MCRTLIASLIIILTPFIMRGEDNNREIYYSCGFENGIPQEFNCIDNDKCELHFTMIQMGFDKFSSWITLREEGTENMFAASASRHKKVKDEDTKPADDWMILPQIWIKGDGAILSWRGKSVNDNNSHASSYKILISKSGNTPEDFKDEPIAVIEKEAIGEWTEHTVDLSEYKDEKIFIAFVNNSLDCECLAIDDISIEGEKGLANIVVTPGEFALGDEEFEIGGSITPFTDVPVETVSLTCVVRDKTMQLDYENLGLKYGETFTFAFPDKIKCAFGEIVNFSISATVNGIDFGTTEHATTVLSFLPKRNVVLEEVTGMWCGYCPQGIVAMETLQERYPDNFLGVAVHVDDPLMITGYPPFEQIFTEGAPSGWIDRKVYSATPMVTTLINGKYTYVTTMGGFETLFLDRMEEIPMAEIATESIVDNDIIHANTTVRFPLNIKDTDFRLSFFLVEDHVWKNGYYQTNYYSGRNESLAGFEDKPTVIATDMEFNHVLRAIYGGYNGIEGIVPSEVTASKEYTLSKEWEIPSSDINISNARLISMVLDGHTGEIVNASSTPLSTAGINSIESSDKPCISCDNDVLTAKASGDVELSIFNQTGNLISSASGNEEASLNVSSLNGIFIIVAKTDSKSSVLKITL